MGEARVYLFEALKIKQDSIFDFDELYKRLFSWFEISGYDFHEKGYEKHNMGETDNLKIYWVATKNVDEYTQFVIEMSFFLIGMKGVEIEKDGVKIKTNKATMEIRMSAYLIKDHGDKLKKKVGDFGRKLYEKFIIKGRLDDQEIRLYNESHLLIDEVKAFVSMHQF
jgi:hypothetical protein